MVYRYFFTPFIIKHNYSYMNNYPNYFGNSFQRSNQSTPDDNTGEGLEMNQRMLNDMTHMYRNLTQSMRDVMIGYNSAINNYNQNMSRFLSSMGEYRRDIHTIQTQLFNSRRSIDSNQNNTTTSTNTEMPQRRPPRGLNRATPLNTTASLFTNAFSLNNLTPTFQDVIIRPTQEQINNATEILVYNNAITLVNGRCPITMEDFNIGDTISRIRHCGHTFHEDSINSWFRTSVRCPVCRYDIRDYSHANNMPNDVSSNNIENSSERTDPDIIDNLTNQLTSMIASAMQNQIDVSQNTLFTFDIPMTFTSESYESDDDEDL